jgi:hypothetical protein
MTGAPRRALFVVGMHRSGTSALTGVLQLLGVELGGNLLPARAGVNDKGFFEHEEIYRIHNALLEALGSSWDDVAPLPERWWEDERARPFRTQLEEVVARDFGAAPVWGLKDPRLCKTLPLWKVLLEARQVELCPVLIGRAPDEVAESLKKMKNFEPAKARALWLRHVLDSERATRGMPRAIVTYDQLLQDWSAVVSRIDSRFGLRWPSPPADTTAKVREFLDPELKRCRTPAASLTADGVHDVERAAAAWSAFQRGAEAPADDESALSRQLDEIGREFDEIVTRMRPIATQLASEQTKSRRLATSLTETKTLAAERDQTIARGRAELSQTRSHAEALASQLEVARQNSLTMQTALAAANASIRRRRRLLRKARRTAAWRLLRAWRALGRMMRRRRTD